MNKPKTKAEVEERLFLAFKAGLQIKNLPRNERDKAINQIIEDFNFQTIKDGTQGEQIDEELQRI